MAILRYKEVFESVKANMVARCDEITDYNEGSIIHSILDTMARLAERVYIAIRQGYNDLLRMIPYSIFGFERKPGHYASGKVVFKRDKPIGRQTFINKGTQLACGGLLFETTVNSSIAAGATESEPIEAIACEVGKEYNVLPGKIDVIKSTVASDITLVVNPDAFTGGTDKETEAEFTARFKSKINSFSGTSIYAVKTAALEINDVRSISIQNHKPPLDNIYNMSIYIDDGSGSATDAVIDKVRLAVEGDLTEEHQGHLAPGINVRFLTPTIIPVDIAVSVSNISSVMEDAELVVTEEITSFVNSLTIGKPLIVSELLKNIMNMHYVTDCSIQAPVKNITPLVNQILRCGKITVNLVKDE